MDKLVFRLGVWSATTITLLVLLIDVGMIVSFILFPAMSTIASVEAYARNFTSAQMLPFIPSLLLAPMFVILIACLHNQASADKKPLSQLGLSFAIVCAAILAIHYYIQLTVVQQGLLNNETEGIWLFASPNPHSLFWTFAALGYGFMGIALLFVVPVFADKSVRSIKWLFITNGFIGIGMLLGNAVGVFAANILASFMWGVLFPIATALLAIKFRRMRAEADHMEPKSTRT